MKIAVLGPVAKDYVIVDNNSATQIGGIPYYVASALQALGVDKITAYITCGADDTS